MTNSIFSRTFDHVDRALVINQTPLKQHWFLSETQGKHLGHNPSKDREMGGSMRMNVWRDMGIPWWFAAGDIGHVWYLRHFLWYVGQGGLLCKLLSTITALRHRGLLSLLHHLPSHSYICRPGWQFCFYGAGIVFITMLRIFLARWPGRELAWSQHSRGESGGPRNRYNYFNSRFKYLEYLM